MHLCNGHVPSIVHHSRGGATLQASCSSCIPYTPPKEFTRVGPNPTCRLPCASITSQSSFPQSSQGLTIVLYTHCLMPPNVAASEP